MDNIKEVTLDDLVNQIVKAQSIIEETEASVKVLKDEVGDRLRGMKVSGTKVGNYFVGRRKLITFPDVTMSQAEELGAIARKIDTNKLRALYQKGIKIKARIHEYIVIKEATERSKV